MWMRLVTWEYWRCGSLVYHLDFFKEKSCFFILKYKHKKLDYSMGDEIHWPPKFLFLMEALLYGKIFEQMVIFSRMQILIWFFFFFLNKKIDVAV